jgi:hypothetical protein
MYCNSAALYVRQAWFRARIHLTQSTDKASRPCPTENKTINVLLNVLFNNSIGK